MVASSALPVVIIGSGAAGMTCALALANPSSPAAARPVVLITKAATLADGGSTRWAQGGIAAAVGGDDSPDLHAADTEAAGAGLVDPAIARLLAEDGPAAIARLLAAGMPFDRSPDGGLSRGREAAHGLPRVLHAGGDRTGAMLAATLAAAVNRAPGIQVRTATLALDLAVEDDRARGVLIHGPDGWEVLPAAAVVLAAGGIGMAWRDTTNPAENTGDGLAMAARAGALLADLEFMQFHPTALAAGQGQGQGDGARLPLLTEALRGAGAVLRDRDGVAFMAGEHPLADLAPRDVVARAVGARRAAGEPVFLDLRPALASKAGGTDAFPTVLAACAEAGLDPFTAPVPIAPAAHYHMGGVLTDPQGRTSLPGLWACGEVACTGVHGANRLASNSLLEGLVFGQRVATDITHALNAAGDRPAGGCAVAVPAAAPAAIALRLREAAREVMARRVGLVRDGAGLRQAATTLAGLEHDLQAAATLTEPTAIDLRAWAEARSLLAVAQLVVMAAQERRESRGAHCRTDFPAADPAQCHRLVVRHGAFVRSGQALPLAAE